MKTLRGLDQKPELIEEITDEKILETIPTIRKYLKIICNSQPKPGTDEGTDLHQIGLKLKIEGDVQLEDAEFKLLLSKAKDYPNPFWGGFIHGQILNKFKEADREAEEKKLQRG